MIKRSLYTLTGKSTLTMNFFKGDRGSGLGGGVRHLVLLYISGCKCQVRDDEKQTRVRNTTTARK